MSMSYKPKIYLRFIGDCHCLLRQYIDLCQNAEYTIQVGDLCSNTYKPLVQLDPERHRCIAGNHEILDKDHPEYFKNDPHFLDDFGLHHIPDIGNIFYVRGAFSIDGVRENEELDESLHESCIKLYSETKPEIVVSHQSPDFLSATFGDARMLRAFGFDHEPKTKTGKLLAEMFEVHEPKLWVLGHYHKRTELYHGNTYFVCLDMISPRAIKDLCYLDIDRSYLDKL